MGEVYLARLEREAGFSKTVALKRILPQLSGDPAFVSMFTREACIAAQLSHRNVVDVYDYGQHGGAYFIAMEYVNGTDLRTVVDRVRERSVPIPLGVASAVVSQVCSGLDYAHRRRDSTDGRPLGIVHRDVSPQNVLVSRDGEVKLTDFGLATQFEEDSVEVDSGQIRGKFAYMSPEQTWGADLDLHSDIFSLGILAYELFCGCRPFETDDVNELIQSIRAGRYAVPTSLGLDLPEGLDGVLAEALAPRPEDRYPDVASFKSAVDGMALSEGWDVGPRGIAALVDAVCPDREAGPAERGIAGTQVAAKPIMGTGDTPAAGADLGRADTFPAAGGRKKASTPGSEPTTGTSPKKGGTPGWAWLSLAGAFVLVATFVASWAILGAERSWTLELDTEPTGASAIVDGTLRGKTPLKWVVPPGTVDIEFQREGFRAFKRTVVLDDRGGVYPVRQALEPTVAMGRVIVTVTPKTAVVRVDGVSVDGDAPGSGRYEFERPAGEVNLALIAVGYVSKQEVVRVPLGSSVRVNLVLRPKPVQIEVRAERRVPGRVTIDADGFRSECGLPCAQRIPYAKEVSVSVVIDGAKGGPWVEKRSVEPGGVVRFVAPVPEIVKPPSARLRAFLVGRKSDGSAARVGLVDANVLTRSKGSRRGRIDGVLAVTFRYEFDPKSGLRITLATDPYSTVSMDGRGLGTTPVVGQRVTPGTHRIALREHNASIHLRFDRP